MRQTACFTPADIDPWKMRLRHWAAAHSVWMWLDSHHHTRVWVHDGWEVLVAVGAADVLSLPAGSAFEQLKAWHLEKQDWLFGGLGYDLKNEVERLESTHSNTVTFPDLLFFQPLVVIGIQHDTVQIWSLQEAPTTILEAIDRAPVWPETPDTEVPDVRARMSKPQYLATVDAIRRHIVEGDLYEMNLCQEFYANNATIDPVAVWQRLQAISHAPMSAFFRWHHQYLLSASPERFLKNESGILISQPIKGTRRRSRDHEDLVLKQSLADSEKDKAENVMIVDLVRNDLARSCVPGTVSVAELFGIYSFETVHQMISTVTGQLRPGAHALDALQRAFPPGSMTGAPKVMAMTLIETYEMARRGWYSGALGYMQPSGDFDFNVLIRSILYDENSRDLSFQVGGAIVFDSEPESEYLECLVKAQALFKALGATMPSGL
jgi:para-aminobenzoate synthetase component I